MHSDWGIDDEHAWGGTPDEYEYDPPECGCQMDDCSVCNIWCTECHGEGWGILGDDFSNIDPLWDGPDGQVVRCPNCHGSGKRSDMTYW